MWKYLRFGYIHWAWFLIAIAGLLAGGWWTWSSVVFLFVVGVGGEIVTKNFRDESNPEYHHPIIHDLIIYSAVVGHFAVTFVAVWVASDRDLLGFGQLVNSWLANMGIAHDVFAARAANTTFDLVGVGMSLGGLLGVSGISAAHELTHRTANPLDLWFGRWDFALSFGGNFATEHVYGHHKQLGYVDVDAVSPKRGAGFYGFLTVGTWHQWCGGLGIEKRRLQALGKSWLSPTNRVLQAWARGAVIVALVSAAGGV